MRVLAVAAMLVLAGCTDDIAVNTDRPARQAPDPAAVCPGTDCWGMHPVDPKLECLACGVTGLVFPHLYCSDCAAQLERCAHCGRKSPAKPPAPYKSETPAPEAPPKEKPREKPAEVPAPPPKAPEPKKEAAGTFEKLRVAPVEITDANRKSHGLLVFAADSENAKAARDAHHDRKQEMIDKLLKTRAGWDAALYVVWGYHPKPDIKEKLVEGEVDPKGRRIRVMVPSWSGGKPKGGIGMDWRAGDRMNWAYVGFRADLSELAEGEYSVEVLEIAPKGGEPRELYKGTFTLD